MDQPVCERRWKFHSPVADLDLTPAKEDFVTVRCPVWTVQPQLPDQGKKNALSRRIARGVALSAVLILLMGCETPKTGFLQATQRNCLKGSAEACALLASLHPTVEPNANIAPPVRSREIVQAILTGMRQARTHAVHRHREFAPPWLAGVSGRSWGAHRSMRVWCVRARLGAAAR